MLKLIFILVVSMYFLVKSSDLFVDKVSNIAKKLGVSQFVIGITLVAVGTSLPELFSSVLASLGGTGEFAIGNVVGSNIANIGLVLGFVAVVTPMAIKDEMFNRDGIFLIFITTLFYVFAINGLITSLEGFILFLLFIAYSLYLYKTKKRFTKGYSFRRWMGTSYKEKYRSFKYALNLAYKRFKTATKESYARGLNKSLDVFRKTMVYD